MYKHSLPPGFVLKTKEQRAAEKALMDKSPLKTLTLEDFLESERHKLTGKLTPVTPETFAKWKKERLDKKQAEDQAREAKEATGRAMFEKGGWDESDDSDEDDGDGDDDEEEGNDEWDMENLRRETERLRDESEKKRLEGVGGQMAIERGIGDENDERHEDEAETLNEVGEDEGQEDDAATLTEVEERKVNGHIEES